ncbi:MAG: hypothetical protein WA737_07805 [Candidatus Acidiferrales bacterium]
MLFALSVFSLGAFAARGLAQQTPASSATSESAGVPTVRDPDEYAVWSALLSAEVGNENTHELIIVDHTISTTKTPFTGLSWGMTTTGRRNPEVQPATRADFDSKNKEMAVIVSQFDLKWPFALVSDEELRAVFGDDSKDQAGWKRFYEKYPGALGVFAVSRVGFNAARDQAMVYEIYKGGYLSGHGKFLVMSKRNGQWQLEKEILMWLS